MATPIRWLPKEWLKVAAYSLPHLDKGIPEPEALKRGMKEALPKARHQGAHTIKAAIWNHTSAKYIAQARTLKYADLQALGPPATVAALAAPPEPEKGLVRWTKREWAIMARAVQWMLDNDKADGRKLFKLYAHAQQYVMPEDRRRAESGLAQSGVKHGSGKENQIAQQHAAALLNVWLLKDVPFVAPEPAAPAPPAPPPAEAAAPAAAPAEPQAEPQAAADAPPSPGNRPTVVEFLPDAPAPAPTSRAVALTAAAEAFGKTVMGGLTTLLAEHDAIMAAHFAELLSAKVGTLAADVATMVEQSMRRAVHAMVSQELGHVAPPLAPGESETAAVAAPAPAPIAPTPEPPKVRYRPLAVDVVGCTTGDWEQKIRDAFTDGVEFRFVNPDAVTYAPHRTRNIIIMKERIPHGLSNKIRACGAKPMYVRGTPGHVIHAIEELQRSQGLKALELAH